MTMPKKPVNSVNLMPAIDPSPPPIDYDAFRAFMTKVCREMEEATAAAINSIRKLRESDGSTPVSPATPEIPFPATSNKRASVTAAPTSNFKRIKGGAARSGSAKSKHHPRYGGHLYVKFSEQLVEFENILNTPMYRVITCVRTDAEATYTSKRKVTLANEPQPQYQDRRPLEYQNRGRKDGNAKALECAFYHKVDVNSPQSFDWRRKLGNWIAECLGKSGGEKYILGAFPEGFTMWEHVRGCWVNPSNLSCPVDPTKLIISNGQLYTEAEVADAVYREVACDKSAKSRPIKEELGFELKAHGNAATELHAPSPHIKQYEKYVFATEEEIQALDPRQQPRFTKTRDDLYLYGYRDNKRYAAPNEFFAHLLWLATARTVDGKAEFPCTCKHCDHTLDKERGANKADRIELAFNKWKEVTDSLGSVQ